MSECLINTCLNILINPLSLYTVYMLMIPRTTLMLTDLSSDIPHVYRHHNWLNGIYAHTMFSKPRNRDVKAKSF